MTRLGAVALIAAAGTIAACSSFTTAGAGERGEQAARDGDWIAAFAAYDDAVSRGPEDLALRRERVRAAHRAGRLPALITTLRGADGEAPSGAIAYELALALASAGAPRSDVEALRLLEGAAQALPDEADIPYRMGLLRLEQELYCEARAPLERSAEMDARAVSPRIALAAARHGCGDQDSAREVLAELTRLSPTEGEVRRARAVLARMSNPVAQSKRRSRSRPSVRRCSPCSASPTSASVSSRAPRWPSSERQSSGPRIPRLTSSWRPSPRKRTAPPTRSSTSSPPSRWTH